MARMRDAFFLVCREDLLAIEHALKAQGMTEKEILDKKKSDWVFFLRYCRRAVPGRAELLHRFDQVYNFFREAKDSANNTILFNDAADKEIKNLRKHIENDCIGDVPGIPLYFPTGRSKDGFT